MDYRIKPGTTIKSRLALKLVRDRALPGNVVQAALGRQIIYGGCLDTVLLELGSLNEQDVWSHLVSATGLPAPEPGMLESAGPHLADVLDEARAAQAGIVPLGRENDTLIAICTELVQIGNVRELATELGLKVALYVVPELRLELARHAIYGSPLAGRFLHLLTMLVGPDEARLALEASAAAAAAAQAAPASPPSEPVAPPAAEPPVGMSAEPPAEEEDAEAGAEAEFGVAAPPRSPSPASAVAEPPAAPAPQRQVEAAPGSSVAAASGFPGGATGMGAPRQATSAAAFEIVSIPEPTPEAVGADVRDAILDDLVAAATTRVSFAAVLGIAGRGDERTARARSVCAAGSRPIRINGAMLGLVEPSPLSVVAESGTPFLGPLGDSQIARALSEDLGRAPVGSVMILPVTIARRVVCLLYADQGQGRATLEDMEALSIFAGQAAAELGRLLREARKAAAVAAAATSAHPLPLPVAPTDPAIRAVATGGPGPAGQAPERAAPPPPAEPRPVEYAPALTHGGDERAWDAALEGSSHPDAAAAEPAAPAEALGASAPSPTPPDRPADSAALPEGTAMAPVEQPAEPLAAVAPETPEAAAASAAEAPPPAESWAEVEPSPAPAAAEPTPSPSAAQPAEVAVLAAAAAAVPAAEPGTDVAAAEVEGLDVPSAATGLQHTAAYRQAGAFAAAPAAPGQTSAGAVEDAGAVPAADAHGESGRATTSYGAAPPPRQAPAGPRARGASTASWPTATEPDDSEFCKLAGNPDTAVRTSALRTLRRRLDHPEVRTFCVQLRMQARSPSPAEALTAIIALGELRDPDAVPVLIDQLRSFDTSVTEAARVALTTIAKQDFGQSRWRWSSWWRRCRGQHRVEWLIEGLAHKDAEIRFSASEELGLLTGEYFGYHFDLPKRQRDEAVRRWQEWWKVQGRKRFNR